MNPSTRLSDSFRERINRPSTRALNLGFIYFKNGELSEAENKARESLNAEKSDKGYRLLGEVLLAQNRHREALEAFSQSLEMNPRQDFCLNKVCELIDPNPASVERLEFWANQAARHGFLDISENFVKASQVARQAGFPNNLALTKIAKDIVQTENKVNQSPLPYSLMSGRPSLNSSASSSKLEESMDSFNKSMTQILDEVKQLTHVTRSQETELKELKEEMKRLTLLVSSEAKVRSTKPAAPQTTGTVSATPVVSLPATTKTITATSTPASTFVAAPAPAAVPVQVPGPFQNRAPVWNPPAIGGLFSTSTPPAPAGSAPRAPILPFALSTPNFSPAPAVPPAAPPAAPPAPTTAPANPFPSVSTNFFQEALKSANVTSSGSFFSKFGAPPTFSSPSQPSQPLFSGFNTPPQPIFGAKPSPILSKPQESTEDDNNSDPEDDRVDVSQYKLPQLKNIPAKIEVKTGEEEEDIVYCQRAKIFRFDRDTKEWKERGIGDLKILCHKQTKKYRVLMRRDQVHKIAINFHLTSEIVFSRNKDRESCASFSAVDFSDDLAAPSVFMVRFKNKELLDAFLEQVEKIQSTLNTSGSFSPSKSSSPQSPPKTEVTVNEKAKEPLLVPNSTPVTSSVFFKPPSLTNFSTGASPMTQNSTSTPSSGSLFQDAIKSANVTSSGSLFPKFGAPSTFSSKPLFSGFNTPPQPIFGAKPSPIFSKPQESTEDDNNSDPEDDRVDVSQYKLPQLKNIPAKIEVKTGEEEEDIVYCQRAKIFRFDRDTKEWKERGIGDLKILCHKQTKKYRVLMRRDQVHKIAINFHLTSEIEFSRSKNRESCASFTAVDSSDGAPTHSGFMVRFKNKELLDAFLEQVEKIQSTLNTSGSFSPSKSSASSASEVEIVFEKKPKEALIEEARKLMLPDNFFNHLEAKECPGCRGCPGQDERDD